MTPTLENIPQELHAALRRRAVQEGKSLDDVALDAIRVGLSASNAPAKRTDLSDIAGMWIEDPAVDAALRDQDKIDPEIWR